MTEGTADGEGSEGSSEGSTVGNAGQSTGLKNTRSPTEHPATLRRGSVAGALLVLLTAGAAVTSVAMLDRRASPEALAPSTAAPAAPSVAAPPETASNVFWPSGERPHRPRVAGKPVSPNDLATPELAATPVALAAPAALTGVLGPVRPDSLAVLAPVVVVTPDGTGIGRLPNRRSTATFTVKNTGTDTGVFALAAGCAGSAVTAGMCGLDSILSQVTLAPSDSTLVVVGFLTGARGATGSVSVRAALVSDTLVRDSGFVALSIRLSPIVTPNDPAKTRPAGA